MKSLLATLSTASLILVASLSNAADTSQSSTPPANRCAVAKSTTIETTADGRTVIHVKTVKVCK